MSSATWSGLFWCLLWNLQHVHGYYLRITLWLLYYSVLMIRSHKRCNYSCTCTCNGVPFASVPKSQAYNLLLSDMSLLRTTLIVAFAIFTMSGLVSWLLCMGKPVNNNSKACLCTRTLLSCKDWQIAWIWNSALITIVQVHWLHRHPIFYLPEVAN